MPYAPLTDEQWSAISALFPDEHPNHGRRPRNPRTIVNAILWVQQRNAKWQDLPAEFGPSQTAYIKWLQWRRCGLMEQIMAELECQRQCDNAAVGPASSAPDEHDLSIE